jgi:protease-4
MKKRNVSFVVGLFILLFIFVIMMVVIATILTFRDHIPVVGRGAVAVIKIEGVLTDTSREIALLHKYAENAFVRAIVMRVETPGGAVGCAQELHREISKVRTKSGKPIVASMGNVAASGGYYVACAADEIYTNPGTVTGSIGVLLETYDLQGIGKKMGIGINTIKSGKFKDTGNFFREMTSEEKEILQETINDTHDQFLEAILEGRRTELASAYLRRTAQGTTTTLTADRATSPSELSAMDRVVNEVRANQVPRQVVKDYLRSIADGRILSGHQAWELGLVDHLGGLHDAIDRAAQLAGVRGKPHVLQEKRKTGFWDLLEGQTNVVSQLAKRFGVALEYRLSFD